MKKNILIVILILIIIIQFIWIVYSQFINPNWNDVNIFIKENTLTNTGATFVVKNKNFISVDYLIDNYCIYKKNIDKWEKLPELATNDINAFNPIISEPHIFYSYEENINWERKYGKLEKGTYRIDFEFNSSGKNVSSMITLYVEFVLP